MLGFALELEVKLDTADLPWHCQADPRLDELVSLRDELQMSGLEDEDGFSAPTDCSGCGARARMDNLSAVEPALQQPVSTEDEAVHSTPTTTSLKLVQNLPPVQSQGTVGRTELASLRPCLALTIASTSTNPLTARGPSFQASSAHVRPVKQLRFGYAVSFWFPAASQISLTCNVPALCVSGAVVARSSESPHDCGLTAGIAQARQGPLPLEAEPPCSALSCPRVRTCDGVSEAFPSVTCSTDRPFGPSVDVTPLAVRDSASAWPLCASDSPIVPDPVSGLAPAVSSANVSQVGSTAAHPADLNWLCARHSVPALCYAGLPSSSLVAISPPSSCEVEANPPLPESGTLCCPSRSFLHLSSFAAPSMSEVEPVPVSFTAADCAATGAPHGYSVFCLRPPVLGFVRHRRHRNRQAILHGADKASTQRPLLNWVPGMPQHQRPEEVVGVLNSGAAAEPTLPYTAFDEISCSRTLKAHPSWDIRRYVTNAITSSRLPGCPLGRLMHVPVQGFPVPQVAVTQDRRFSARRAMVFDLRDIGHDIETMDVVPSYTVERAVRSLRTLTSAEDVVHHLIAGNLQCRVNFDLVSHDTVLDGGVDVVILETTAVPWHRLRPPTPPVPDARDPSPPLETSVPHLEEPHRSRGRWQMRLGPGAPLALSVDSTADKSCSVFSPRRHAEILLHPACHHPGALLAHALVAYSDLGGVLDGRVLAFPLPDWPQPQVCVHSAVFENYVVLPVAVGHKVCTISLPRESTVFDLMLLLEGRCGIPRAYRNLVARGWVDVYINDQRIRDIFSRDALLWADTARVDTVPALSLRNAPEMLFPDLPELPQPDAFITIHRPALAPVHRYIHPYSTPEAVKDELKAEGLLGKNGALHVPLVSPVLVDGGAHMVSLTADQHASGTCYMVMDLRSVVHPPFVTFWTTPVVTQFDVGHIEDFLMEEFPSIAPVVNVFVDDVRADVVSMSRPFPLVTVMGVPNDSRHLGCLPAPAIHYSRELLMARPGHRSRAMRLSCALRPPPALPTSTTTTTFMEAAVPPCPAQSSAPTLPISTRRVSGAKASPHGPGNDNWQVQYFTVFDCDMQMRFLEKKPAWRTTDCIREAHRLSRHLLAPHGVAVLSQPLQHLPLPQIVLSPHQLIASSRAVVCDFRPLGLGVGVLDLPFGAPLFDGLSRAGHRAGYAQALSCLTRGEAGVSIGGAMADVFRPVPQDVASVHTFKWDHPSPSLPAAQACVSEAGHPADAYDRSLAEVVTEIADPPWFRLTIHVPGADKQSEPTTLFTQAPTSSTLASLTQLASEHISLFRPHKLVRLQFPAFTPVGSGSLLHVLAFCDVLPDVGSTVALFDGREFDARRPAVYAAYIPRPSTICELAAVAHTLWPDRHAAASVLVNGAPVTSVGDLDWSFPLVQPVPRSVLPVGMRAPPFSPIPTEAILERLPGFAMETAGASTSTSTTTTVTQGEPSRQAVWIAFAFPGSRPKALRLKPGFHFADVLWELMSDPAPDFPFADTNFWEIVASPRLFPERSGGNLALVTVSTLDPFAELVWIDIRTDVPILMVAEVGIGRSRAELIDRFCPGHPDILVYLDGALAGEVPDIRPGSVLTFCRETWECLTQPLSRSFESHPSLRILQTPFALPPAVKALALARRALAATAIPVHLSAYRTDFMTRLQAEYEIKVGWTGRVPHQAVLTLCSPAFGTCTTSVGSLVAPSARQLRHYVRAVWPDLSDCCIIDTQEFFDESFYFCLVDKNRPLVSWIRAQGSHDDVLFLPPTVHPRDGLPCPPNSHVHVYRHEGSWGLFTVRHGPAPAGPPEAFAARAIAALEEERYSSPEAPDDHECDSGSAGSDLSVELLPGPASSVTEPGEEVLAGASPTVAPCVEFSSAPQSGPAASPYSTGATADGTTGLAPELNERASVHSEEVMSLLQTKAVLTPSSSTKTALRCIATPCRNKASPPPRFPPAIPGTVEPRGVDPGDAHRTVTAAASANTPHGSLTDLAWASVAGHGCTSVSFPISIAGALVADDAFLPGFRVTDMAQVCATLQATTAGRQFMVPHPVLDGLSLHPMTASCLPRLGLPLLDFAALPLGTVAHLYTDGSLDDTDCGWAVAVFFAIPGSRWHFQGVLAAPTCASIFNEVRHTSDEAESAAVAAALSWSTALPSHVSVIVHVDCDAARHFATGFWSLPSGRADQLSPAAVSRALFMLLEALGRSLQVLPVRGHTQHPWNELADVAAKAASKAKGVATDFCWNAWRDLIASPLLPWAWLLPTSSWHYSIPPLMHLATQQSSVHAPRASTASRSLSSVYRLDPGKDSLVEIQVCLRCASLNVLTLRDAPSVKGRREAPLLIPSMQELLQSQCHQSGHILVGLQETRLPGSTSFSSTQFLVFSAACDAAGQGGCALWANHQAPYGKSSDGSPLFLQRKHFFVVFASPQLLFVRLQAPGLQLLIVVGHGPHSRRPEDERVQWWQQLHARTASFIKPSEHLVLFLDANARVGSINSEAIGPSGSEKQTSNGSLLHTFLLDWQLCLPCTLGKHQGNHPTWQSPLQTTARLDYVAVPGSWLEHVQRTWVDYDLEFGQSRPDHWMTCLEIHWLQSAPLKQGCRLPFRPGPPDPHSAAAWSWGLASMPPIAWMEDVDAHAQLLTHSHQRLMRQHQQVRHMTPRQPFVTPEALLLVRFRKHTRRQLQHVKTQQRLAALRRCFQSWKYHAVVPETAQSFCLQEACLARVLTLTSKELSGALRAGKKAYLTGLAKQFAADAQGRDWLALWKSLSCFRPNQGKKRRLRPLLSVKSRTGQVLQDQAEVGQRWAEHFGNIEGGHPSSLISLGQAQAARSEVPDVSLSDLPTRLQWESAFKGLRSKKAPGPDGVTAEFVKQNVPVFAATSYSLCLKTAHSLREPLRWRGGTAIPLWKGKQDEQLCSSYRSILVSELLSKRFHAWMRKDLLSCFEHVRTDGQCGITGGSTCAMLSLWVRAAQRYLHDSKVSHGVLFTDIVSAFYSTLRQFVMGAPDLSSFMRWCRQKGIPEDGLDAVCTALLTDVARLSDVLSPVQKHRLRDVLSNTWFFVPGNDLPVGTERGTRPGDPLADLIYGLVMGNALRRIELDMESEGLAPQVALAGILPGHLPGKVTCAPSIAWHDDAAFVFVSDTASALRPAAARATGIVWSTFQSRGLALSFAQDKTEMLLNPQGKGSDRVRKELFTSLQPCIYFLPDEGCMQRVSIVRTYTHLGSSIDASLSFASDIQRRLRLATDAAKPLARTVFRNAQVPLDVRVTLFRSLVLSRLTHNIGAWSGLTKSEQASWQKGCMRLYKYLLPAAATREHIDSVRLCKLAGMPAPLHLLRFERLRLLGHCASKGFESLLQLLEGTIGSSTCWVAEAMADVQWLISLRPVPSALELQELEVSELFTALQGKPTCISHLLAPAWGHSARAICYADFVHFKESARVSVCCPECGHVCKGKQGLHVHLARRHGVLTPARYYAPSHQCLACKKIFATRERVIKHLSRRSPACLRYLQDNVEPMSTEAERRSTKAEVAWRAKPRLAELGKASGRRFAIPQS